MAGLVAYRSGAEAEARLRGGLGDQLAQFDRERLDVANASVIGFDDRLAGIEARYDTNGRVVRALGAARPEIQRAVAAIEARLARAAVL